MVTLEMAGEPVQSSTSPSPPNKPVVSCQKHPHPIISASTSLHQFAYNCNHPGTKACIARYSAHAKSHTLTCPIDHDHHWYTPQPSHITDIIWPPWPLMYCPTPSWPCPSNNRLHIALHTVVHWPNDDLVQQCGSDNYTIHFILKTYRKAEKDLIAFTQSTDITKGINTPSSHSDAAPVLLPV